MKQIHFIAFMDGFYYYMDAHQSQDIMTEDLWVKANLNLPSFNVTQSPDFDQDIY